MTTLSNIGIPGVGTGILHPVIANRFKIRYGNLQGCSDDAANFLSMQTVSLNFDLVTCLYVLKIHQPLQSAQDFFEVIRTMCDHGFKIKAEILDGNVTTIAVLLNEQVYVHKHHAELNYATAGILIHTLELSSYKKK